MPNDSPCGFVRDLGKDLLFSQVSDEAARRNVRHKIPISVTKNLNSIGMLKKDSKDSCIGPSSLTR